jgi:hypothetical protein
LVPRFAAEAAVDAFATGAAAHIAASVFIPVDPSALAAGLDPVLSLEI